MDTEMSLLLKSFLLKIKKLEKENKELIEALIRYAKEYGSDIPAKYTNDTTYINSIELIEKHTGKKWEDEK